MNTETLLSAVKHHLHYTKGGKLMNLSLLIEVSLNGGVVGCAFIH